MRKRVATANAAFNAHRRTIFQNRGIPMKKRTQLFHTLILSKLVYGSESWVLDTIKAKEYLHASVMRLYRRLCGLKPDDRSTDLEVLAALQLPSPTELFRQMRLRYLGTLHSCAEVVTWSLLNADNEWCALIRDDLSWMWTQLARSSSLPNPAENTDAWKYLWKFHNRYWKGLMKRAIQQAQLQRCNQVLVCQAHRNVLERLSPEGMIKRPEDEDALQQPVSEGQFFFGCIGCRMTFKSKGGEGVHMCKRHGTISSLRFLFDETRCEFCLKEKHTFGKLHNHLRHSQSCREGLQRRLSRCIPAEGMQHKSMQSKKRDTMDCCHRSVAKDPVCPSHWLVRWKILMWTSTGSAEVLLEGGPLDTLPGRFIHKIQDRAISWTKFAATVHAFRQHIQEDDLTPHEMNGKQMRDKENLRDLEWQCANCQILPPAHAPIAPQQFGTHRYILHAFSGRRRQGDFQFFLDELLQNQPGITVHTLSVDIILDPVWGDVANPDVQQFWTHAVRQKWVIGFLEGPPWETWSRAREHSVKHQGAVRDGPRVVRTVDTPWGIDCLALREIRLLFGNQLMFFAILMIVELYYTGGCGALEHPALPSKQTSASIWRTPLMELLLSLHEFALLEFAQGLLGAATAKPTMILAPRLPSLSLQICKGRVVADLPKGASLGLGNDGKFRTMILKEYPPSPLQRFSCCIRAFYGYNIHRCPCAGIPAFPGHVFRHARTGVWNGDRTGFRWVCSSVTTNSMLWPRREPLRA